MVLRRKTRLQKFYSKNKNTDYSNIIRKQPILAKLEFMIQNNIGRKVTEKEVLQLDVRTIRVMNEFLHKTLDSTVLLNNCGNNGNEIKPHSSGEKYFLVQKSDETRAENAVEYPYHTLSGYRAMTQKKGKMIPPSPSITFYVKELKQCERERTMKNVETLRKEVISQRNILQQVTKALTYCCSSDSKVSLERVECERLLLLALHKYTAVTKKIELLKADIRDGCLLKQEKGSVTMSNLTFDFNHSLCPQIHYEETNVWVLCLLSHEETVVATEVQLLKEDLTVKFQNSFTFNNLLNDFQINIQLFILPLQKKSNVSKQYFKKFLPSLAVRSQRIPSHDLIDSPILARQAIFKAPAFHLKGSFLINLENLKSSLTWNEYHGQMRMSLKWDVESKVETSGFLTVREEIGEYFTWERRWCFLEACRLKFWNYPADKENMSPLKVLDLRQCLFARVEPSDNTVCSRPRTFFLEMTQMQEGEGSQSQTRMQTIKYIFSTDTNKDLLQWCMVLNKNLELLKKWMKIN